ncbi:hypothetical protein NT239_09840 [Chitinibacter sp. SCUT-21]|uniref:anti-sigma factor family protein n=1 Tax=Chitinibacter sp. SCUT-21 TaxID=2970891 RepID=UPI0035A746D1
MLKCREVTRLLTLETEQPLNAYRQVAVTLHLAICHNCRRHRRQLRQMRDWLDQEAQHEVAQADHTLSAEARQRIAEQLKTPKK